MHSPMRSHPVLCVDTMLLWPTKDLAAYAHVRLKDQQCHELLTKSVIAALPVAHQSTSAEQGSRFQIKVSRQN